MKVKMLVAQACLTPCDPMDCTLWSASVHGIFQARIPEWVAMPFSQGSSHPRDIALYVTGNEWVTNAKDFLVNIKAILMSVSMKNCKGKCGKDDGWTVLLGLVYLWPIISVLFPHLTSPRTLPNVGAQKHFAEMHPTAEACGYVHTYYQMVHPPFLTPKESSCVHAGRGVFLDLRSGHLISLL